VGLVETKRGGKERKIASNNEVHYICIGTRHTETVKQHRIGVKK
jgi:hypothetical protein